MKEIKLTQGKVALIDDEDFEKVNRHKWFVNKGNNTFYASTWVGPWRERKNLQMHHLIMGRPKPGHLIDHADRNGLNNQRYNLRSSTVRQNCANRTPHGASGYLGVSLMRRKSGDRWRAFISDHGVNRYLGIFKSEIEAAQRYNDEASKVHGEFANLNRFNTCVMMAELDQEVNAIIVSPDKSHRFT